jgi:hypothetical protein
MFISLFALFLIAAGAIGFYYSVLLSLNLIYFIVSAVVLVGGLLILSYL